MIGDNIVRGGQRRAFQQEEIIMDGMKNISKAEVLTLRDQVAYQSGQVVSRTLAQNEHVSVTLFSFDKGEEISTHESGGDAMVTCLDGVGQSSTSCTRANPSSCPRVTRTRCTVRSSSRCCSSWCSDLFIYRKGAKAVCFRAFFAPLPQGGALSRRMLLCVARMKLHPSAQFFASDFNISFSH